MTPDKCPKCGASPAQPFGGAIAWNCGSYSPYASGIVCQSPACLTDQRDKLAARVKRLEEALVSIQEYWNRDENERAMSDACWHAINTAAEVLEAKEAQP